MNARIKDRAMKWSMFLIAPAILLCAVQDVSADDQSALAFHPFTLKTVPSNKIVAPVIRSSVRLASTRMVSPRIVNWISRLQARQTWLIDRFLARQLELGLLTADGSQDDSTSILLVDETFIGVATLSEPTAPSEPGLFSFANEQSDVTGALAPSSHIADQSYDAVAELPVPVSVAISAPSQIVAPSAPRAISPPIVVSEQIVASAPRAPAPPVPFAISAPRAPRAPSLFGALFTPGAPIPPAASPPTPTPRVAGRPSNTSPGRP